MTSKDWQEGLVVVVAGVTIALFPVAVIWSLNTLFGTGIRYGWSSWAAIWVLAWSLNLVMASTTNVVFRR